MPRKEVIMKKWWTIPAALIMGTAAALSFSACSDQSRVGVNGSISISYYKGGTGSAWIEEMAEAFEKDTGIAVNYEADNNITVNAKTLLEAGRNLPDIMFVQYTNWREYVQKGWLADMDDLYDGTFSYTVGDFTVTSSYSLDGTKSEFKTVDGATAGSATLYDILDGSFRDYGNMAKTVNDDSHFWVIPWTAPATGLAYNVDILAEAGWSEPPATETELKQCIADIKSKTDAAPFAWGGTEIKYWDFVVFTWWAQYQGVDEMRKYYDFESTDVFLQEGRSEALSLWQELVVDPATGDWINSIDKPMSLDHLEAEYEFAQDGAAFVITGAYLENEIADIIDEDFNFKMMAVPTIDEAKETGSVLNTEAGSFACIPAGAENIEKAKAFLAYMNRPEQVENFTQASGIIRPFNYSPSKLDGSSEFSQSVFKLYEESTRMWRYSDSGIFTYAGVSEWPYYGSASLYGNLAGASKKEVSEVINTMYSYANKNWNSWKKAAGIA